MDEHIDFIGISDLEGVEQDSVKEISLDNYQKIERKLKKHMGRVVLHIKLSKKGGKSKKYDLTLRVESPEHLFESSADDWDLIKATHMVFEEIMHQIDHRLKK